MEVDIQKIGKGFTPIRLTLELESPDEAIELWHRLNIPHGLLFDDDYRPSKTIPDRSHSVRAWNALNTELEKQGY